MKKYINKLVVLGSVIIFATSCKTVIKSRTADYDYMYITKTGIKQRPLVTDLEVGKVKISITKTYLNVSISEAKENVLGDYIQQNGCDLVVQPMFETNTVSENEKNSVTVTLTAYPAFYKNIRNFELQDTSAFILNSYTNAQNVPIISPVFDAPKSANSSPVSVMQLSSSSGKNKFGLSANVGMPAGDYKDVYNMGYGGAINYLIGVNEKTEVSLSATYLNFSSKNSNPFFYSSTFSSISPKLGIRYNALKGLFVEPQIGYSFLDDESGLSYAVGVGYYLSKKTEIGLKYDNTTLKYKNFNYLGARIGFYF